MCWWLYLVLFLISRGQSSSVGSGHHQCGADTGGFCSGLGLSSKTQPRLIHPEPDRVPSALQIPFLRSGLLGRRWRTRGGILVLFIRAQVRISSSRRSWRLWTPHRTKRGIRDSNDLFLWVDCVRKYDLSNKPQGFYYTGRFSTSIFPSPWRLSCLVSLIP